MQDKQKAVSPGLTLIELMVVFALLSIVMSMAFSAFTINENYRDLVYIKNQLYRQNKKIHDIITEELAMSQSSRFKITKGPPDVIRFQIPWVNASDPAYGVVWGARYNNTTYDGYYINYKLNGTNLVRELLTGAFSPVAGTQEVKASGIWNLTFSNSTPSYITINTTARRTSLPPVRPFNLTVTSNVSLQN